MSSATQAALNTHLLNDARNIFRPARGFLKHPYLVPGAPYDEQLWDWDSFWVAKALLSLPEGVGSAEERAAFLLHAEGSWKDMLENQAANGMVPILSTPDLRDVFGCTEDPTFVKNQAKPILGQFAIEIAKAKGDFEWLRPYFPNLIAFLASWRSHYLSPCGLLVWGSDVAIGVDNDPTTYGRPAFSSANLLLNCFYYRDLQCAAEIARALGETAQEAELTAQADALREAIRRECWDPIDGFYYTVDVRCEDHRALYLPQFKPGMDMAWQSTHLKIKVFTGFLPLWCGIATAEEAQILVERHYRNPEEFHLDGGLPSLAKNERMYAPDVKSGNPSNWEGPVWIVASYMVWEGLLRYGFHRDADDLARKTTAMLGRDLQKTGTLHEYYHPESGEPVHNAGFLSWNLLAILMAEKAS